jgi:hypothetical protein
LERGPDGVWRLVTDQVTDAADGVEQAGAGGPLELHTQSVDVDVDDVGQRIPARVPDGFGDRLA